jgi:glycosyltransferase involved in cell wall biosynthesis
MRLVIDLQGAQGSSHARGIGRYSRELALAMARAPRGHEVIVVLSGALPDTAEDLADAFATVLPRERIRVWHPPAGIAAAHESPWRDFAAALRAQFLASLRPDLVHVSSLFEGLGDDIVTWQPPRLERLPVVATCFDLIPLIRHAEYFGEGGVLSRGAQWYYRCAHEMALCDGLLAISESSRGEAIRHLPFPPERVFNIQAGVSEAFRPAPLAGAARAALLARYGLRDPFVLFLGAGDVRKNEAGLVAGFAALPPAVRDRHQLAIVGRTDEEALRRTAARLRIPPECFTIVPFVAEGDLNALYSACAAFVFPSLHEGFGLPVAEAMACGAPVIASNTSSLPEVIGRADATFDPADPASIAACLCRVLENPAFRAELAAHGPVQAARFTWPATAARAWDALEAIQQARTAPAPGPVLATRPRLAFVSPLPPQASGIADYSRDLLPALARHYDISLVSEAEVSDIRLRSAFPLLTPAAFLREGASFDRVLHQIGNSSFHRFQIEDLLPHCPGVVVLHDAFLSDYVDWLAHEAGRPDDFRLALWRSHGYAGLLFDAEHGRSAALSEYPCCLPVLSGALGVIQHSRHAVAILRKHFGAEAVRDVAVIPLLRSPRARPDRAAARASLGLPGDLFVVASFGAVTALKCPELVAEGWRRAGLSGRLVFAGEAGPALRETLVDEAAGIVVTGRLAAEEYDAWLAAADLAVQWRRGSRGESSAAVGDALTAGLPVIVNRHGSAAELPDAVALALPDEADAASLAEAIIALRHDPARRAALAEAARCHAARALAPEEAARLYRDAIERAYAAASPGILAQRLAPDLAPLLALPGGTAAAARGLGQSFPSPWRAGAQPRLLIDMSELARRDSRSGIQRAVRELGRRVLRTPPPGRQGAAARARDGRLRHTHAEPLRLLGQAPLDLPEQPVDAGAGDVLLCADVNAELTAAEYAEFRRLRLAGLRIVLLVYDLLPVRHPELFPEAIGRLVSDWYTRMLAIADAAVCISRVGADDLAAWLDDHPAVRRAPLPIGAFHLGSDFPPDDSAPAPAPEVAAALAATRQRPTVLMIGTVEPRKGYPQAVAAFERLWAAGEDIGLAIIGKQGWKMEAFAEELRAATARGDRLHWLSNCTNAELHLLYGAGAGLLMASSHEGFGLPIIEAAQAGLPVLARDLPVFREIAGTHAHYFSGEDAGSLAEALRAWRAEGFAPASTGMQRLNWDDSYRALCDIIYQDRWHRIWQP